jgi:hypothetical protein
MSKNILTRALARESFEDLQIIDCHDHMGPCYNFYLPRAEIDEMVNDADQLGVSKLCVAPHLAISCDCQLGNQQVNEATQKYPDKVWGLLTVNGNHPEEISSLFDRHYSQPAFVGIKIHPSMHKYSVAGENYALAFEHVKKQGGFVLAHSWDDCPYANIALCEEAIKAFPGIPFILAHAGGIPTGVEKAIRVVNKYANAFIDSTGSEFSDTWIEEVMAKADNTKILYGSDTPFHDMRNSFSRILMADLDDCIKESILSGNFKSMVLMNPRRENM